MADNRSADEKLSNSGRRSLKRKLEDESIDCSQDLKCKIHAQIELLEANLMKSVPDRAVAKRAIHVISELAKFEDNVNLIVESGVVPALVKYLHEPQLPKEEYKKHSKSRSVTPLIWGALPQPRSDRQKDRVETNPEQFTAASVQAEKMTVETGRTTRVIGWYHSHLHITVLPSHAVVSLMAAVGFLVYGGRLFVMLRQFPIESKGRQ